MNAAASAEGFTGGAPTGFFSRADDMSIAPLSESGAKFFTGRVKNTGTYAIIAAATDKEENTCGIKTPPPCGNF